MPNLKTNNGIDWYYETFGEGEQKLLFLHGWGVDRRIWRQQYKHFRENYQVMILDLPGHGNSSFDKVPLKDMVHDIREVLVQGRGDLPVDQAAPGSRARANTVVSSGERLTMTAATALVTAGSVSPTNRKEW